MDLKTKIFKKKLPDTPGVYFFLDASGKVLYIGKATSLRDRVRSYFARDISQTRGPKIVRMLEQARDVKWRRTDSALEALLLESRLIRDHWPPYNTDEKDDKSWNFVIITDEAFPRVLTVRGRDLEERPEAYPTKWKFGPFLSGGMLKEALALVRRIFPYRDRCVPSEDGGDGRPCFNAQIGLCPGVCSGSVTAREYARNIRHIKLFFDGRKKELVRRLRHEIEAAARRMEFEKASALKGRLFALEHVRDVSLLKKHWDDGAPAVTHGVMRIEAYDVAHLSGKETVGVMTVIENGEPKKSDYRKFKLHSGNDDVHNLEEMIARRLRHEEWPLPDLIVADGFELQIRAIRKVLREFGRSVMVVSVVKDDRHRPKDILGDTTLAKTHREAILLANAEAHRFAIGFHRARRGKEFLGKVATKH